MARSGIYKSEVLRAREKLLAQGVYPSIDAVRTELGNTGSKSTIHRYLKEIEEEEGGATGAKVAISEALQDLVGRLASRVHEEADERIQAASARFTELTRNHTAALELVQAEAASFRQQLERTQVVLTQEQARHEQTAASLRTEVTERTKLAQQVQDLQERLQAEERHRQSLEEKHQHAREALDHFRQSAKEQREQEQRQHEQQVQYLQGEVRTLTQSVTEKQHEAIRSNQENARLTTDLARAESGLHQAQAELRVLKGIKEQLESSERNAEALGRRVVEQDALVANLKGIKDSLEAQVIELTGRTHQLDIDLATVRTTLSTQGQIAEQLQTLMVAAAQAPEELRKGRVSKIDGKSAKIV